MRDIILNIRIQQSPFTITLQFPIFLFLAFAFKEFSIGNVNANVYVNLFLFHLRSEVLIIEGYYTKYPNPTPTISFSHFKESYETFSVLLYFFIKNDLDFYFTSLINLYLFIALTYFSSIFALELSTFGSL